MTWEDSSIALLQASSTLTYTGDYLDKQPDGTITGNDIFGTFTCALGSGCMSTPPGLVTLDASPGMIVFGYTAPESYDLCDQPGAGAFCAYRPVTQSLSAFWQTDTNDDITYRIEISDAFLAGAAPVPEPATWAMMIVGFGLVGIAMRCRSRPATVTA